MALQHREQLLATGLVPCPAPDDDEHCPICHFEGESEWVKVPCECRYIYHDECIRLWLANHNNCPSCRKELFLGPNNIFEFMASPHAPAEQFNLNITDGMVGVTRYFLARHSNQASNHNNVNWMQPDDVDEGLINADVVLYCLRNWGRWAMGRALLQGTRYTDIEVSQLTILIGTLGEIIRYRNGHVMYIGDFEEWLYSSLEMRLLAASDNGNQSDEPFQIVRESRRDDLSDEDGRIERELQSIVTRLRAMAFMLQFDDEWRTEEDDHVAMMQVSGR